MRNGLCSRNCSAVASPHPWEIHERGDGFRGGNTRNYSEALRCVGVKRVDFNVRLVKRDSLLAISCVFSCF